MSKILIATDGREFTVFNLKYTYDQKEALENSGYFDEVTEYELMAAPAFDKAGRFEILVKEGKALLVPHNEERYTKVVPGEEAYMVVAFGGKEDYTTNLNHLLELVGEGDNV